ncbi:tyrosine-type recombinase/integrase [Phaeobacter sp. HF9A]|uniref:tyrosine-type recombinase/integrase n=1 Tax=Phaeobacter sp. HF9A TaxID=2721561 RepID=UPI0014315794|nr:tyrosine-type recombinase/integrase [Phaeobacter sp. HF9A]NIZ14719.1 tyrosine-type recombinase/integrase [Phaeobacter sp. HF9A]
MPKYIQLRRRVWYAVLEIPKSLRPRLKKPRFFQSLKTESRSEAERLCLPIIHQWKELIESVRSGTTPTDAIQAMRQFKLELERQKVPQHEIEMGMSEWATETEELAEAHFVVNGDWIVLSEHIDEYTSSLSDQPKTVDMKRKDLDNFSKRFKYAHDATNRDIAEWVEIELIEKGKLQITTCRRIISNCRGYWLFLQRHYKLGLLLPFENVVPRKKSKANLPAGSKRQHFTKSDFQILTREIIHDAQLHDLIYLAAHTGARIEELCSLRLDSIDDTSFGIEDAKTSAGIRKIPIHSAIKRIVERLRATSQDGFLISGLTINKYGDRSNAIGKRFGRLKKRCGFGEGFVFHSFRKGVATQLEEAGISENISARLLGHELQTMTYGLYSGGVTFETLQDAVEKLDWER